MITIRCQMGVHSGRTPETIVRRRYGRNAHIRWSHDLDSEFLADIIKPVDGRRKKRDTEITRRFGHETVVVIDRLVSIEESLPSRSPERTPDE